MALVGAYYVALGNHLFALADALYVPLGITGALYLLAAIPMYLYDFAIRRRARRIRRIRATRGGVR